MANEFRALGVSMTLDCPPPPPSLDAWYGPASYHPLASRRIFHETLHFWQFLGSGYLARLVEEDWERLTRFELSGMADKSGPRRAEYLLADTEYGFGAIDLVEALARYWDVQVIGPPDLVELDLAAGQHRFTSDFVARFQELKQRGLLRHPEHGGYSSASFDLAMEGPGGGWAQPYVLTRDRLPGKAAATLFPIAGYLALQTSRPVETFALLVSGGASLEQALPTGADIGQLWRWALPFLQEVAVEAVPAEDRVGSATRVIREGSLSSHPIWRWLAAMVERAAAEIGAQLDDGVADQQTAVRLGSGTLIAAFACPGDPDLRGWLVPLLMPPLVMFADGSEWYPAHIAARSIGGDADTEAVLDDVVETSRALDLRWRDLLLAARGY